MTDLCFGNGILYKFMSGNYPLLRMWNSNFIQELGKCGNIPYIKCYQYDMIDEQKWNLYYSKLFKWLIINCSNGYADHMWMLSMNVEDIVYIWEQVTKYGQICYGETFWQKRDILDTRMCEQKLVQRDWKSLDLPAHLLRNLM